MPQTAGQSHPGRHLVPVPVIKLVCYKRLVASDRAFIKPVRGTLKPKCRHVTRQIGYAYTFLDTFRPCDTLIYVYDT
jgi:hypothetical protein